MSRVAELAARREALLIRSADLRAQLAGHGNELEDSLTRVDRGLSMVRAISSRPLLITIAAGLLFSIGPLRTFRWVSRGLFLTSIARKAYGLVASRRNASLERPAGTDLFV